MRRSVKYGSQSGILTILFAAILVVLYLSVSNHNTSWDLSANAQNRLDPKTIQILQALKAPVKVKVFDKKTDAQSVRDLLELYRLASPRISYEIIDPDAFPDQAKTQGVDKYGQSVVLAKGKRELVDKISEESLTNALFKLDHGQEKVVYFLEGHGEKRLADPEKNGLFQYSEVLKKNNYLAQPLQLMQTGVPADAAVVAVVAPQKDLLPAEAQALQAYLDKGGRLLAALEPGQSAGLDNLLAGYGVIVQTDFIIDTQSRAMGADYNMPVVYTFGKARELAGLSSACIFPSVGSLEMDSPLPAGVDVDWLARTSDQSWSETDLATWEKNGKAELDERDKKGPRIIAMQAKKTPAGGSPSQVVALGDADFLCNTYLGVLGNRDLALIVMNMLAGQGALVNITAKPGNFQPFMLTPSQATISFAVPVVVIPGVVLIAAIAVFFMRRKA